MKDVAAVVVTRGDVDLTEIVTSYITQGLAFVYVWDNSREDDVSVYGRYAALSRFDAQVVIAQDDDCVLAPESIRALLDNYTPGWIVANMPARFRPHYPESCLVGFGAIFARELPGLTFDRLTAYIEETQPEGRPWPKGHVPESFFNRECDTVFTALTPRRLLDLPYRDLPHAHWPDRLWKQPEHGEQRARMLELARQVRDATVTA